MLKIVQPTAAALYATMLMAIAEKSPLVRTDTVETFRSVDAEKINGMIDEGQLRWVWDFNNGAGKMRQLRFLALEVLRPELTKDFTLENALRTILGEAKQSFSHTEISRRFRIHKVTVHHFHQNQGLPRIPGTTPFKVSRASLETFLRQHWIGGGE